MSAPCPCNKCTGRKPRLLGANPTHRYVRPPRAYEYTPPTPLPPMSEDERRAITSLWLWSLRQARVRVSPV